MNTYIPLILTTIVTISTIIYTICSIQLWRTTRAAAEISRQAAFSNLWAELNRYLEILREQNAPETAFLQKVSELMVEFMVANLVAHAIEKNDPRLRRISPEGLNLNFGKRSPCFENSVGHTLGRAEKASLICATIAPAR